MSRFDYKLERSQATGIVRDNNGLAFIPATQRPDGTWRKAREVKAGFVPDEDRKKYETAASRYRRSVGVPGMSSPPPAEASTAYVAKPKVQKEPMTKNAKKNMKKSLQRQKKREEKAAALVQEQYRYLASENSTVEEVTSRLSAATVEEKSAPAAATEVKQPTAESANALTKEEANAKRMRIIRKKLRQIDDLQAKVDEGVKLDALQMEKIAKRDEWVKELESLEAESSS